MQTHEIVRRFTDHFVDAGHTRVSSASLILDDPTLLFVNAGMVQFKPYFLGEAPPPYPRATSIQKCVRTGDIDEVGRTTRHNTFFQMAGNFSFGDYFKAGAIEHAWNLVTASQDAGGYGFDPDRIWVTVYQDDDEAVDAVAADRRAARRADPAPRRQGQLLGHGRARPGRPVLGDLLRPRPRARPRRRPGGRRGPLPGDLEPGLHAGRPRRAAPEGRPPADRASCRRRTSTPGMGVERVAYLLQGVDNVYETDLVRPVITRAEEFSGRRYGADHVDDVRFRVIADHARSGVMIIGDGVTPVQRGPRLRAAPAAAADRALGAAARRERAGAASVRRGRPRRDGADLPGARQRLRADLRGRRGRGGGVPADAHRGLAHLRHRRRRDEARPAGACCPATRRSSCTTPTASRSTSPWRWRPRPACRRRGRASAR